jgi:hypothetical protein
VDEQLEEQMREHGLEVEGQSAQPDDLFGTICLGGVLEQASNLRLDRCGKALEVSLPDVFQGCSVEVGDVLDACAQRALGEFACATRDASRCCGPLEGRDHRDVGSGVVDRPRPDGSRPRVRHGPQQSGEPLPHPLQPFTEELPVRSRTSLRWRSDVGHGTPYLT